MYDISENSNNETIWGWTECHSKSQFAMQNWAHNVNARIFIVTGDWTLWLRRYYARNVQTNTDDDLLIWLQYNYHGRGKFSRASAPKFALSAPWSCCNSLVILIRFQIYRRPNTFVELKVDNCLAKGYNFFLYLWMVSNKWSHCIDQYWKNTNQIKHWSIKPDRIKAES